MPLIFKILVPVLLGAAIGYFTNDLAIRMLFRPRRPVFIGKWRLPFTPGIIPRNQGRIAGAVAAAVSGQPRSPKWAARRPPKSKTRTVFRPRSVPPASS